MGTSSSEHRCCWWCGQRADSKEHRFKASDLRWMFQDSPSLWLDAGERPTRLQGPGAKAVLFPHVLCRDCNSARSQPFDDAYSAFFTYICEGAERFRNLAEFSMEEIYSSDAEGPGNLARYFMKNFACRIASMGFEVPQQVIEFMNGAQGMHNACLLLAVFNRSSQQSVVAMSVVDRRRPQLGCASPVCREACCSGPWRWLRSHRRSIWRDQYLSGSTAAGDH